MYFIRFNDIAVFAEESRKLAGRGIRYEIIDIDGDVHFEEMCKRYPYANTRKVDYFTTNKDRGIPRYVMDFIKGIDAVKVRIEQYERDIKLDDLLGDI